MAEEVKMDVDEHAPGSSPNKPTLLKLMHVAYRLSHKDASASAHTHTEEARARAFLMESITDNQMGPLFDRLVSQGVLPADAALSERLRSANTSAVEKHDAAIAEAREKFGDVEVYERQKVKAEYLASIGDSAGSLKAYGDIAPKSLSTGQKIDIVMAKARLALAFDEWSDAKKHIEEAKDLNEKGGDWDRRNRLKVYEGIAALVVRDFKRAAELFLDSVATFTAVEVLDYKDFVFYTVLAALKSVDRVVLKKKVIDSPDVLSVINEIPYLPELLNSFYDGRYRAFLVALTQMHPIIARDRYLQRHASYYLHESRIAAYVQFLESYKSVTLAGMATAFGVSTKFLDADLARFIASGRVSAKMDAISGIIETTRPDAKNAQYHAVLKHGDGLLNKVQKLARVVAV